MREIRGYLGMPCSPCHLQSPTAAPLPARPSLRLLGVKSFKNTNESALFCESFPFVAPCVPYTYKLRNERRICFPRFASECKWCYHFLRFNALTLQLFNEWRSDSASQKPLSRADLV